MSPGDRSTECGRGGGWAPGLCRGLALWAPDQASLAQAAVKRTLVGIASAKTRWASAPIPDRLTASRPWSSGWPASVRRKGHHREAVRARADQQPWANAGGREGGCGRGALTGLLLFFTGAARRAGTASDADGFLRHPDQAEEPHPFHPGEVRPVPRHPKRHLQPQLARATAGASPTASGGDRPVCQAGAAALGSGPGADRLPGGAHPGAGEDHPNHPGGDVGPRSSRDPVDRPRPGVGSIERFPSTHHLAGYCGTVPRVKGSGGKFHHGRMIKQANDHLKWAFRKAPRSEAEVHRSRQRHRAPLASSRMEDQVRLPGL